MSAKRSAGLGQPEPAGKKSLFQPPAKPKTAKTNQQEGLPVSTGQKSQKGRSGQVKPQKRVRTTIDLTAKALAIIQTLQNDHRLQTGRALPLWKAVSDIVESYGERNGL